MNRLRAYRDIEGINQEELGRRLGISPQMVSAIESGRREFSGNLETLGYASSRISLPDMSSPLHRQRASTSVAATKRACELLRLAGEVFAELLDRTDGAPRPRLERYAQPLSLEELEELAGDVRCGLGHEETGPIRNLTAAVERAGVCLIPIVGLTGIDGLSAWVEDVPVIGLSPSVPGDRFRLSLSHELAHLLVHSRKTPRTESEANRFAGALLFPQIDFETAMPAHPNLRDFISLKSTWGMSVAALVYRAHELDFIDDSRYRALQIQMSKWRKNEPARFEPVQGRLISKLIDLNGGPNRVASELGFNPRHLDELLNWSHLRVA